MEQDDVQQRASESKPGAVKAEPPSGQPRELEREIEQTRDQLGDTVEALAGKVDVKSQLSRKVDERKAALRERQHAFKTKVAGARQHAADATPEDAKRAATQLATRAESRPFPAIAVALVVGFLTGRFVARR